MLTTFHATNYKGLQFEELSLGKLNLYVGPNNCGKSNLFSAMSLVWEMAEGWSQRRGFLVACEDTRTSMLRDQGLCTALGVPPEALEWAVDGSNKSSDSLQARESNERAL